MDSAAVTYKSPKIVKPSLLINLPMILCSVNLKMFVKGIPTNLNIFRDSSNLHRYHDNPNLEQLLFYSILF